MIYGDTSPTFKYEILDFDKENISKLFLDFPFKILVYILRRIRYTS